MEATIRYGVIGCGARIKGLVKQLNTQKDVEVKCAWDPSVENAKSLLQEAEAKDDAYIADSYEALLQDDGIDWVLIGSPNRFHAEHIISSLKSKKHVFSEKPIAIELEELMSINEAHEASARMFATGFTLRYASIYREVKRILTSGKLGKIVSISASENIPPEHGTYIMRNWRRHLSLSGPHILEKCVHDLDLINWFADSVPVKVAAFGGNGMFVEENNHIYLKNKEIFDKWEHDGNFEKYEEDSRSPFLTDKTIEDHIVAIMTYANDIKVQFQATTSNIMPERRMYISCTEGTLIVELYSGTLTYQSISDKEPTTKILTGGGHGDGDTYIMKELRDSMVDKVEPVCSGQEGMRSAVTAFSIDKARRENTIVDLSSTWKELGVTI